jgi:hypothetical protein
MIRLAGNDVWWLAFQVCFVTDGPLMEESTSHIMHCATPRDDLPSLGLVLSDQLGDAIGTVVAQDRQVGAGENLPLSASLFGDAHQGALQHLGPELRAAQPFLGSHGE